MQTPIILSKAMQYREFEQCLTHFRNADWNDICEELNFSELRKVMFGLSLNSLDAESSSHAQDVNKQDRHRDTALYHACSFGHEDYTGILLNHRADPNAGAGLVLPLVAAIRTESPHCVSALLEHNAKILCH